MVATATATATTPTTAAAGAATTMLPEGMTTLGVSVTTSWGGENKIVSEKHSEANSMVEGGA